MKEEIIKKLGEYHKIQGVVFLSRQEELDYFKGLVELIENIIEIKIN